MEVICTATNAALSGVPIPAGAFTFPMQGAVDISFGGPVVTNLVCSSGDTLAIWQGGAAVLSGPEPWLFFMAGFSIVMLGIAVVAIIRKAMGWTVYGVGREF